jgi:gamma-glutamylcyclotransferase (GGCT)/AIG2-like uncharacterized protein YtfP
MKNIFTYGTLMSRDVWNKIISGNYKSEKGILAGYERKKIINKSYPGLIESPDEKTSGIIYFDVDEDDLKKLDSFEGDEYKKIKVKVKTIKNKKIICIAYLYKKKYKKFLSDEKWSFESFLNNDLENFISNYEGWEKF